MRRRLTLLALLASLAALVWLTVETKALAELAGLREVEARAARAAADQALDEQQRLGAELARATGRLEIADQIATLHACVRDKGARDEEGRAILDALLSKISAGVDDQDKIAITKAFADVLNLGVEVRPHDNNTLSMAAAAALGNCGPEGSKKLKTVYGNKLFPEQKEWVPLREQLLKSIGKTRDESMVAFLCTEAQNHPEPAIKAAAGEALGNFAESKDTVRKEIVSKLLFQWGDLEEKASQMGSGNVEAQNARDTLAVITDAWNTTLARLTRQDFRKYTDWQTWKNKNRNLPWQ